MPRYEYAGIDSNGKGQSGVWTSPAGKLWEIVKDRFDQGWGLLEVVSGSRAVAGIAPSLIPNDHGVTNWWADGQPPASTNDPVRDLRAAEALVREQHLAVHPGREFWGWVASEWNWAALDIETGQANRTHTSRSRTSEAITAARYYLDSGGKVGGSR